MIACVYGSGAADFVEPTIRDLARAAASEGTELIGVKAESLASAPPARMDEARLIYVLPFDTPLARDAVDGQEIADFLIEACPKARVANSVLAHELCTDRIALSERLLERGVAVPETLVTSSPDEAREFIDQFEHAVLRDPRVRGHAGGFVVFTDGDGTVVGEARDRRYVIELVGSGIGRRLEHGVLSHPPPFFLQRMVTGVGRRGVLIPAQVMRAYVVDDQIAYWTETYRDRIQRPSDFLLSGDSGAPRRFVQVVSNEAEKLALRVSKAIGCPIVAVDIIRSDSGYVVLDVVTDGRHVMIDRSFKNLPEYRDAFNLDRHIAEALVQRVS